MSPSPAAGGRYRSSAIIAIKVLLTAGLLYLVLSDVDLQSLRAIVGEVPPQTFAIAIALHIVVFVLGAFRWWLLARRAGIGRPFLAVVPSYYLGVFSSNFLPTGVGGDVVRVFHLKQQNVRLDLLVTATISDRLIGLSAVAATGLTAMAITPGIHIAPTIRFLLLTLAIAAVICVWLLANKRFGTLLGRLAQRFHDSHVRRIVIKMLHSIHQLHNKQSLIFATLAISIGVQILVTFSYYLLARSVGLQLPLTLFLAIVPVVFLAATLPISIGGLGVREGTFVALMVAAGAEKSLVVSVSVAYLAVFWVSTLPGSLSLLISPSRVKAISKR